VLLSLIHGSSQWLQGNQFLAAGIFAAALVASSVLWRWLWPGASRSVRQLRLGQDGSTSLLTADGRRQVVALRPGSMRLGPYLLLVLRAEANRHRLLLGPENVDPGSLAALRRRLRRPPAVPGLAVDCLLQQPRPTRRSHRDPVGENAR